MRRLRVRPPAASKPGRFLCPTCGSGELRTQGLPPPLVECDSCGCAFYFSVLRTLEQIVALPDTIGEHACECGHPEMRLLPDGMFHCPACRSEVLPAGFTPEPSERPPSRSLPAFARMPLRAGKASEPA
jgi:transcription elongation factor Elf1